eukprot:scaffold111987_cov13-Tisochrysis_lutea.AAC.1
MPLLSPGPEVGLPDRLQFSLVDGFSLPTNYNCDEFYSSCFDDGVLCTASGDKEPGILMVQ